MKTLKEDGIEKLVVVTGRNAFKNGDRRTMILSRAVAYLPVHSGKIQSRYIAVDVPQGRSRKIGSEPIRLLSKNFLQ